MQNKRGDTYVCRIRRICTALGTLLFLCTPVVCNAADLRVLDGSGLVRGVKVVQDSGNIEVIFGEESPQGVTCTLKNVDGLATDKSVSPVVVGGKASCIFRGTPAGTWQLSVSKPTKWSVRITGEES